ncbi:ATP-dependent DNA helicase UvrD/PcrA [Euzebya pacifica]|uniref:DNA 3'-5' helicase n=1 Tax=Euzebya pacifica TaxID=1608957 RepID=A0A346Y0C2_9ACTN|nr:ATP-dependent helicase [Euzebya pacifica]AXV07919.1 ATP-dependent DNA helicase UvrD/PcrA [Euzebya pacifica]
MFDSDVHDAFAHLNSAQHDAVAFGDGPLLILAGAGTGKTTTLAARVARLVADGVDPQRILLLTFTRRAAGEMLSRARRMVAATGAPASTGKVMGGTFHAIANRLLRRYADRIGLATDFGLLDAADAADLIDLVRDDLEVAKGTSRFPRKATLASIYGRVVNSRVPLKATLESQYPWCAEHTEAIGRVFTGYGQRKRARNLLDYDDLLLFWKVLAEAEGIGDELGGSFDHVLVDEYQDTNALQAEIVAALRRTNDNVTVVGDDAQAVYGFRAASVRNILDFPQTFPGTRIVRLEQSYRSTQPILDTANALVAEMAQTKDNPEFRKSLFSDRLDGPQPRLHTCHDEDDQSARVCDAVLDRREQGTPLVQQAVLFRTSHHADLLELELSRRNIPYVKYGGLKFLEAAHVKDLVALLRLLDNPDDELAWFRILQRLEGIGPGRARVLMEAIGVGEGGVAVAQLGDRVVEAAVHLPAAAERAVVGLAVALGDTAAIDEVAGQVQRLREWYGPVCAQTFEDPIPRMADLQQLEVLAEQSTSRTRFLDDLVLDPPASTGDLAGPPLLDEDYLILSTIHSAKGLEWDTVHLLHAADGMIPSDMSTGDPDEVEEERRLLYVALTRPRHELDVYVPLRYYHQRFGSGDRHSFGQVSRFLQGPVRDTMARVGPRDAERDVPVLAGTAADRVDALLDELW